MEKRFTIDLEKIKKDEIISVEKSSTGENVYYIKDILPVGVKGIGVIFAVPESYMNKEVTVNISDKREWLIGY